MLFALGFLAGLAVAILVAVVHVALNQSAVAIARPYAKKLELAGPRTTGGIFMPESEEDLARREIIEANAAQGRDTPISELMSGK